MDSIYKQNIKGNIMYHLAHHFGHDDFFISQKTMTVHGWTYKMEKIMKNLEILRKEGHLSRKIHKYESGKISDITYYIKELRPSIEKVERGTNKILSGKYKIW